ncbi:MAG: hypothetical protein HY553_01405 [Elusimicrobia bacterium]|nr:hypothetical protein [Elusimicrobiota bacterium]
MILWALLFALTSADAKETKKKGDDSGVQEITIKGKGPGGPPVRLPPVAPDGAVANEVADTLKVLRTEHKPPVPELRVPGGPVRRLAAPFPEPPFLTFNPRVFPEEHDRWRFEVMTAEGVVWRRTGRGRATDPLEWDGTDETGRVAARVGRPFHFRFTGVRDGSESSLTSESIELGSILYRESLGDVHMEVGSALLFPTGKHKLLESAAPFLRAMASRLGRINPELGPLKLTLYQRDPDAPVAKRRARAVKAFFLKALIVNASRLEVSVAESADRGEVLATVLPPDGGAVIRDD